MEKKIFDFNVKYHADDKKYEDDFHIDCLSDTAFIDTNTSISNSNGNEAVYALKVIAHALEDSLKTKL